MLHTGAQWAKKLGFFNKKLNKNTALLSVLSGGALGMFVFAAAKGKEQVHNLHPIFQVGADPKGGLDYRTKVQKAKELERNHLEDHDDDGDTLDLKKLEQHRLVRRRSLMDNLETGHGLSDSHGGRWETPEPDVDRKKLEQHRMVRRRSLMDTIQKGHGLSDSHGGQWYGQNNGDERDR